MPVLERHARQHRRQAERGLNSIDAPAIRTRASVGESYTTERCHIVELSNCADDPDVSIAQARVEPGVTTRWHRLADTVERYVIVSGHGIVEIGDLPPTPMEPGDVAVIPAMTRQRITNPGPADLVFLALCTPRFEPACYEELDDTPSR